MEPMNQISIESFSYGWLNTINPTFDFDRLGDSLRRSFEALDGSSFIEMDPDFFSIRWTDLAGFDFSLPASSESSDLVLADQIFSNGKLLPSSTLKKKEARFSSDSALDRSISIDAAKALLAEGNHWDDSISIGASTTLFSSYSMPLNSGSEKLKLPLNSHRRSSPGRMLRKYLNFLIPLYRKVKRLKMMSSRTARSRRGDSPTSSAKSEFSNIDRNRASRVFDWEFESSIHDAVLHCKKSVAESAA